MTRPTFNVEGPLVRIAVKGVPHPKGFPHLPDDRGVVGALLHAMNSGELPHEIRFEVCGGGQFIGLWRSDEANRVVEWLKQFADRVEVH